MDAEPAFRPEAEEDISEAYAWYEEQRPGLGEEFLSCVDACVGLICRSPELYPLVREEYRRGLVRRFPYVVYYKYDGDRISIYGVFHTSRDPEKWKARLS